jgi:hypothetical protein
MATTWTNGAPSSGAERRNQSCLRSASARSATRKFRIAVGLGLVGLVIAGAVTAPVAYAVWFVSAILLVTGIVGFVLDPEGTKIELWQPKPKPMPD